MHCSMLFAVICNGRESVVRKSITFLVCAVVIINISELYNMLHKCTSNVYLL